VRILDTRRAGAPLPAQPADSFEAFYRRSYVPLVRLAFLLVGSQAIAEELAQEAFLAVYRNWTSVAHPWSYSRLTVTNRARDLGRRSAREPSIAALDSPSVLDAALIEFQDVLLRLPYRQRAVIVLRYFNDVPDEEIAEMLGCRRSTVRSSAKRGLAALRKEMDDGQARHG
jgi:RNA polymerase sigma factor (sigma-70 family)